MRTIATILLVMLRGCGDDDATEPVPGPTDPSDVGDAIAPDGDQPDSAAADADETPDVQPVDPLIDLLAALRADPEAAMAAQAGPGVHGWPAPVRDGYLVVSLDDKLTQVGGEFDDWTGTAMTPDGGFHWLVVPMDVGGRYKFTDGTKWEADPWSRAYEYDEFGLMSRVAPVEGHLERFFKVSGPGLEPRTLRIWVPEGDATHVLYLQDGQNLFDPTAIWGGWKLTETAPKAMMLVGIDNSVMRFAEYTHVTDDLGGGPVGGEGDTYAAFVQTIVRGLIAKHYGEPGKVGVMGSSLGGLISFHIAYLYPGEYLFAGSLSGTMGWGSIHPSVHNETMIERYAAADKRSTALYLDSGGSGTCVDSDDDGIEDDDPTAADNYCVNIQLQNTLLGLGYESETDLWHWWEQDAPHNEAAGAARVWRPLEVFAGL